VIFSRLYDGFDKVLGYVSSYLVNYCKVIAIVLSLIEQIGFISVVHWFFIGSMEKCPSCLIVNVPIIGVFET